MPRQTTPARELGHVTGSKQPPSQTGRSPPENPPICEHGHITTSSGVPTLEVSTLPALPPPLTTNPSAPSCPQLPKCLTDHDNEHSNSSSCAGRPPRRPFRAKEARDDAVECPPPVSTPSAQTRPQKTRWNAHRPSHNLHTPPRPLSPTERLARTPSNPISRKTRPRQHGPSRCFLPCCTSYPLV